MSIGAALELMTSFAVFVTLLIFGVLEATEGNKKQPFTNFVGRTVKIQDLTQ